MHGPQAVRPRHLSLFVREFARLVKCGVSPETALYQSTEANPDRHVQSAGQEVLREVYGGVRFEDALARPRSGAYGDLFKNAPQQGLEAALDELLPFFDQLDDQAAALIRQRRRQALRAACTGLAVLSAALFAALLWRP